MFSNILSLLRRSVSTVPGQTALTAMPDGPSSSAMVWVSRITPALAAQYGPRNVKGRLPAWLETLQMRPPTPAATLRVAQDLETRQVPIKLTSSPQRNSSAWTPSNGPAPNPRPLPPATLATSVTV